MNRRIDILVLLCLVVALDPPVVAQATDCRPWAESTDLSTVYPEIQLDDMVVLGSLLVGTDGPTCHVYQMDGHGEPGLISSVSVGGSPGLRALDGQVYLLAYTGTSHRLDLADPENPQLVPVTVPSGALRDVVGFDGGYLMLSSADSAYVVEDPTAADPGIISAFETIGPKGAVVHGSVAFIRRFGGVQPVDLSDPANPIIGSGFAFHSPDGVPWFDMSCKSIMVHEGILYGGFRLFYHQYDSVFSIMAFDITDPFEPLLLASHFDPDGESRLDLVGNRVVVSSSNALKVYEVEDLEPVAAINITSSQFPYPAGVSHGEDYLLSVTNSGLHRVDLQSPQTIDPTLNLPDGYDPANCGRYGLATRYTYSSGATVPRRLTDIDWTIYDQTTITALDSLTTGHVSILSSEEWEGEGEVTMIGSSDRWVVVHERGFYSSEMSYYETKNLVVLDMETGNRDEVEQSGGWCQAVLRDDLLWTLGGPTNYLPDYIRVYRLTDDGAVLLDESESTYGVDRIHVADEVYLIGSTSIKVLSLAEPVNLTPVRELLVDQELSLREVLHVEDSLLYAVSDVGMAVIDLDPPSPEDPVVIGSCSLEIGRTDNPSVRQGQYIIVHRNTGWQAVDISDPTMPVAASPMIEASVSGLHWSGDLLYVDVGLSIQLYDITDLANPQWVGQSAYQPAPYPSPCALDGYVVSGSHALLPDCNDITPIEPIEPDAPVKVPAAVTLTSVVPNPFNPSTTITFDLRRTEQVKLMVHDLRGRRLATLLDRECPPGGHQVQWLGCDDNGRALPSGTYLVQLRTESAVRSTKAVLVR